MFDARNVHVHLRQKHSHHTYQTHFKLAYFTLSKFLRSQWEFCTAKSKALTDLQ